MSNWFWIRRFPARNSSISQAGPALERLEQVKALTLLEVQRNAMLMYTSCGWFFTEISGIETVQILKYAARIFDFLETLGHPSLRMSFLRIFPRPKATFRIMETARIFINVSWNPPG